MNKGKKRVVRRNNPFERRDKPVSLSLTDEGWDALLAIHKQSPAMPRNDIICEALKLYARSRKAM